MVRYPITAPQSQELLSSLMAYPFLMGIGDSASPGYAAFNSSRHQLSGIAPGVALLGSIGRGAAPGGRRPRAQDRVCRRGRADPGPGLRGVPRGRRDRGSSPLWAADATSGRANARLLERGGPAGSSDGAGWGGEDRAVRITRHTRNTFIASSPKWLMTLTAMRPEAGLGKAREMSLLRVAQASGSISAFSVVLSAL